MSFLRNLFSPRTKKKEVLLLKPLDYRGEILPVDSESDRGVYTHKIKGVNRTFFKFGPAWTFPNVIRFLGVEGTPLTGHPTIEGFKITVRDFLKEVWGKDEDGNDFYDKLPDNLRTPIESEYGIICGLKTVMPDERMDLTEINANSVLNESNIAMMRDYAKSTPKKNTVRDTINFLLPVLFGFFLGIVVQMKGWF